MFKRIVSYFTVICIAVSLFSVTALAEEAPDVDLGSDSVSTYTTTDDYSVSTYSLTETDLLSMIYDVLYAPESSDGISYSVYGLMWELIDRADATLTNVRTVNGHLSASLYAVAGSYFLDYSGSMTTLGAQEDITYIVRSGFMGMANRLRNYLYFDGSYMLNDGSLSSSGGSLAAIARNGFIRLSNRLGDIGSGVTTLDANIQDGLDGVQSSVETMDTNMQTSLGTVDDSLHDLISGSETDNVYSGTITTNENTETVVSSTGLGPMLNTWLDEIQHDTGLLSYMFASPDDLETKAQSAEMYDTLTDTSAESGGDISVSAGDISSLKGYTSNFTDYLDAGVEADAVFDVLNDEENYAWFTEETASQLDTTVSALALDDEESEYERYNMQYYNDHLNSFLSFVGSD